MLDPRFQIHNYHIESAENFSEMDPHLRRLKKLNYIYNSPIISELPTNIPGIYTLSGGRQIGKTTMLKQWMQHLLYNKIEPSSIIFLTGEIIYDQHSLISVVTGCMENMAQNRIQFLIIDEITYIKNWDKGIKFLADSGAFDNSIVILTGSDLITIKEARMTFPGRRGKSEKVDYHIYPLSFKEVVDLLHPDFSFPDNSGLLQKVFINYLTHGGYLTAINDFAENQTISKSTLMTYADWIRGDVLKRGKNENYLKEFLHALLKTYGSQVSWNSLSHHISIDHTKTIQDYAEILESMDVLFVQHALMEDKLTMAPKKAKKLFLTDPFILHAITNWMNDSLKYQEIEPKLAETAVISNIRRHYPTFYIKADGEVDIAYIQDGKFWPIEIKWTNQLRAKDLKQVQKYNNSRVISKTTPSDGYINGVKALNIAEFLYNFT